MNVRVNTDKVHIVRSESEVELWLGGRSTYCGKDTSVQEFTPTEDEADCLTCIGFAARIEAFRAARIEAEA